MKCTLLNPAVEIKQISKYPPLGLGYIASALKENGIEVEIIDAYNLGLSHDQVTALVVRQSPAFVGITVSTENYASVLRHVQSIKKALPEIIIILGGPHVHILHQEIITDEPLVDYCVRGEGEITTVELVKAVEGKKDISGISGITFRKNGKTIVTAPRPFIEDLDRISFPARELMPNHIYRGTMDTGGGQPFNAIIATRGCPFACGFCSVYAMWGNQRRRSVENVLSEMELLKDKYGIKYLRFPDDLLVLDNKWAIALCQGMIKRGLHHIKWDCNGRVGVMSDELLHWMKKAGCHCIYYGIEFGSQRLLEFCRKGFKLDQVHDTVNRTKKAGMRVYGLFMIGYPTETRETILDTINLAKKLPLDYATFQVTVPFPGTPLYDYCREKKLLKSSDWSEYVMDVFGEPVRSVIKLDNLDDRELIALYHRAFREFNLRPSYMLKMMKMHPQLVLKQGPKVLAKMWRKS